MIPKKIRFLSLIVGVSIALVAGSIALACGLPRPWTSIISTFVCIAGIFWGSGLVTRKEVLAALSNKLLNPQEICRVINSHRGLGPVDEFNQADIFIVKFMLGKLKRQDAIHENVSRLYENGHESVTRTYRLKQLAPGYGIDRITGHLRHPHPSA